MNLAEFSPIDCDIHPTLNGMDVLVPYLEDYWREMMPARAIERLELTSYPPNAPLSARPDWKPATGKAGSDLGLLQSQALDHFHLRYAIANFVYGVSAIYNEYIGAALCGAVNDWLAEKWLAKDKRLRASIVIHLANPETAAEEIEKRADDKRFVQVLVLAQGDTPLGRKQFWPIYKAAERHDLPIGIHAGSMMRHPPTQSGYPSYLVEDYVSNTQAFTVQVVSMLAEGVFNKFPRLRVVLLESGVTFLPAMMWRMSKDWRGVRPEVPWIKRAPANILRDNVRMTIQPFDAPPDPLDVERLLDHLGSEDMLLFATDYPHYHYDGDNVIPAGIPPSLLQKILVDNPLATYPRLKEDVQ